MAEPVQRDVVVAGSTFTIRAVPQADGSWRATVGTMTGGLGDAISYLGMDPLGRIGGDWTETAQSGDEAADALAGHIRGAVTQAVSEAKRSQLEEANRRHQERNARKRPPG